ncbi:MAG: Holliday junction resolvase RuvX [Planctomycetes bacterium]|nr:Holliday junction resolvase RuvX [Planctomycetota bacterium]
MSAPGRRLAIDYGRKRIGLARCDGLGLTTQPLPMLQSTTLEADLKALARVVAEEEIVGIVIGIPLQLDGNEGRAAQEVKLFAAVLRERLHLDVDEVDERLSTKAAHALLKDAGQKHAQRKGRIDSTAARLILQSWLERRKHAPPA